MKWDKYIFTEFAAISYGKDFMELFNQMEDLKIIGEIHSIYRNVINFKDDKGIIYAISSENIGNSPFTLRVNTKDIDFRTFGFKKGDAIFKSNNRLNLQGILNIKLGLDSCLWMPKVKKKAILNKAAIAQNIKCFNKFILEKGSVGGCRYYYLKNYLNINNYRPGIVEIELAKRIDCFIDAINNNYMNKEQINPLIGFGIGLTPSGDDFLVGFISVLNIVITNYSYRIKKKLINLVDIDKISTTDVSRQTLYAAIKGRTEEHILNVIDSFLGEDKKRLKFSFKKLFEIGSSSGTDLAVGIVVAFILLINNFNMEE